MGEDEDYEGEFKWGVTTSQSYFPKDKLKIFLMTVNYHLLIG